MATVEISTKVTANGAVIIPPSYTKDIPAGSAVRVLIRWEDWVEPTPRVIMEQAFPQARSVVCPGFDTLSPLEE